MHIPGSLCLDGGIRAGQRVGSGDCIARTVRSNRIECQIESDSVIRRWCGRWRWSFAIIITGFGATRQAGPERGAFCAARRAAVRRPGLCGIPTSSEAELHLNDGALLNRGFVGNVCFRCVNGVFTNPGSEQGGIEAKSIEVHGQDPDVDRTVAADIRQDQPVLQCDGFKGNERACSPLPGFESAVSAGVVAVCRRKIAVGHKLASRCTHRQQNLSQRHDLNNCSVCSSRPDPGIRMHRQFLPVSLS